MNKADNTLRRWDVGGLAAVGVGLGRKLLRLRDLNRRPDGRLCRQMTGADVLNLQHVGQREDLQVGGRQAAVVAGFPRKFDD